MFEHEIKRYIYYEKLHNFGRICQLVENEYFELYDKLDEPVPITVGNKEVMLAYGKDDIVIEALVNGEWLKHRLQDVCYTPEVVENLLSVLSAADNGYKYVEETMSSDEARHSCLTRYKTLYTVQTLNASSKTKRICTSSCRK